jgi:site-specific DNA recombinase
VWGGNGVTDNLMCSGSREWKCWNSIGFNGPFAAEQVAEAIGRRLDRLQGLDDEFQRMVEATRHGGLSLDEQWAKQRCDEQTHARHTKNVLDAITELGLTDDLRQRHAQLEQNGKPLAANRHRLESAAERVLALPASMAELRELRQQQFKSLAVNSFEFGDLIRELVPQFYVYLVRLCDGGHLMPRAKVKLNLLGSFADAALVPGLEELLAEEFTMDLFQRPPQRERVREQSVILAAQPLGPKAIAAALDEKPTSTAVQRALGLHKKMIAMGLNSPYVLVDSPPEDYNKLRRHKSHRYRFEPLDGYNRPEV